MSSVATSVVLALGAVNAVAMLVTSITAYYRARRRKIEITVDGEKFEIARDGASLNEAQLLKMVAALHSSKAEHPRSHTEGKK